MNDRTHLAGLKSGEDETIWTYRLSPNLILLPKRAQFPLNRPFGEGKNEEHNDIRYGHKH